MISAALVLAVLGAPPAVELAGTAPVVHRYALVAGASQRVRVEIDETVTQTLTPPRNPDGTPGQRSSESEVLPRTEFTVTLTVAQVGDGGATIRATARSPRFSPREGTEPGAAAALDVAFKGIPEIAWTLRYDPDGALLEKSIEADRFPASTLPVLQRLVESVGWAWFALPREPLGVGGRFRSAGTATEGDFKLEVVTVGELGGGGVLTIDMRRTSVGEVPLKDPPEGIKGVLADSGTHVHGTLVHDERGFPKAVRLRADASVTTKGQADGEPFELVSSARRQLTITAD